MPLPAQSSISRGVAPPAHHRWLEERSDVFENLVASTSAMLQGIEKSRALFKKHVHENPDAGPFDFRQHRAALFRLMADADEIILEFCMLKEPERVAPYVTALDNVIAELLTETMEWHAPEGYSDSVPESFKRSIREMDARNVLDFPSGSK